MASTSPTRRSRMDHSYTCKQRHTCFLPSQAFTRRHHHWL